MGINIQGLRRLHEAACRDRNPRRFFADLSESLEKKELRPSEFSIRQLFENFVEDGRELADSFNPRHGGGVNLVESGAAVDTSAFSNITGQIVYSAIMESYQSEEFVFSNLIPSQPTSFNGEKIPGIGQIGDKAEIVDEMGTYPTVGVNEDWIETPQTTKRGLIVPVTKEAIFFDRTGILLQQCGDVGTSLGINREKRAIDCVVDENSTTHRYKWRGTTYATYQASTPWVNVQASNGLVDWTDVDAAEQLFDNMVDPNTGEPIMVMAKDLIVTRQRLQAARRVLTATTLRTATPGYATSGTPTETEWANPVNGYTIRWSRLLAARMATDTTWYIGDVAKAFKYMENWPLTVVTAPANSEAEFTQDIVQRYKVSDRGTFSTWEPRAMVKCTE